MDSYPQQTRVLVAVALASLLGGVGSDVVAGHFFTRHPVIAGLLANLIVIMLSVAVINEALQRRHRRRWRVLAQYAMFDITLFARLLWTSVLDYAGLLPITQSSPKEVLDVGGNIVRDADRLLSALRELLADNRQRHELRDELGRAVRRANEMISRWAPLMLSGQAYAEIMDRHVELASDIALLSDLLDDPGKPVDVRQRFRSRFDAVMRTEAIVEEHWLAARIVMVTQLAEKLDRDTFDAALRLVPAGWWEARLTGAAGA